MLALSLFTTVPVFCSAYTFFVNYLVELLTTIVRRHTAGAGICEPGYSKVRRTLNAILYCKDCKRLTRIFAGLPINERAYSGRHMVLPASNKLSFLGRKLQAMQSRPGMQMTSHDTKIRLFTGTNIANSLFMNTPIQRWLLNCLLRTKPEVRLT